MNREPLENEDPRRRTDLSRDAASSTLGDDNTGPKPARLGPSPVPGSEAATPMQGGGNPDNQRAAAESRDDVAAGAAGGRTG